MTGGRGYNTYTYGDEGVPMSAGNGEYKDRLFNFLFGSEENRAWTLSLYNAVNGSAYDDPSQITFTTIREVMYLGMHNDVSFLVAGEMSLYEQQSSFNPNMPLRMLQYLGNLYQRHVDERRLNKYGSALIPLPAPRLVVFYNGGRERPDEEVLRLSDAFPAGAKSDVEVRVRAVNVNWGHSRKLLAACAPLREYAWLVARVREGGAADPGADLGVAIDRAIDAMPDDYEIKPFLTANKAEVRGMLLTEYDEAKAMELFREEGLREGRLEGRREGVVTAMLSLVKDGLLPVADAARRAGMTVAEFERVAAELTLT